MKMKHFSVTKKMANHEVKPRDLKEARSINNPGEENYGDNKEETLILVKHGSMIIKPEGGRML